MLDLGLTRFVLLMTPFEHRLTIPEESRAREECLMAGMDVCRSMLPMLANSYPDYPTRTMLPIL
jgi:hypothetical protein